LNMNAPVFPGATLGHRTRFERRLIVSRLHRQGMAPKAEPDRPVHVRREPRPRHPVELRDSRPLDS